MEIKKEFRKFLDWLWNSDSLLSYIVLLGVMFILVKFILLPGLGFLMGTSLPLAIVESSSMDHGYISAGNGNYEICGAVMAEKQSLDLNKYWWTCGSWYEEKTNITEEQFAEFKFKNGFRKGDLMVILGEPLKNIKIGDVLVFTTEGRPHPIIHRVISLNPLSTKGDHNPGQLSEEMDISEEQIIGVAKARVPYIGWLKLFFVELFR